MAHVNNIFISYGRADAREFAIRLRDDLQAVGYRVWLDLNEIPGGASWSEDIENAIEHSHTMIALLSPASYASKWCRAEQLRARRKGKKIIPLLVDATAEIPLQLEHINYLDFTQVDRYDTMFSDLLSDLNAGAAFAPQITDGSDDRFEAPESEPRPNEKRTAGAFRRTLKQLRREAWLGSRYWWPSFLFHFADLHHVADILQDGELRPAFEYGAPLTSRFDKSVRLYFRPRTPDFFFAEGFLPATADLPDDYAPIPVYLLFDMNALIVLPDSKFSDGDPDKTKTTYQTPRDFRELPFEQIYHDSWFMPDEREEIMRCREAQVLVPHKVGLEALQLIWLRSPAEYETLHHLLDDAVWQRWRDKITVRADYHLFNHKSPYVETAVLREDHVRLRFAPCEGDCGPFMAMIVLEYADGTRYHWQDELFKPDKDVIIDVPQGENYTIQLLLDGDLAYMGKYQPHMTIL